MLEFFRRHRGAFMIVLAIVVIIAFSFWGGPRTDAQQPGDPTRTAFNIYGRDYSVAELGRYQRYMRLAYMLGMYDLPQQLVMVSRKFQTQDEVPLDFVFNLLVLRKELEKNGIAISNAEAEAELKKLPSLQNNGVFDPARASMAEDNLGAMGFRSSDMLEIVKDKIGLDKLKALISGNFDPSPVAVTKTYARQYQTVKASTITFALEDFKKQAQVKDDEIKKYYEEKKETYKTPEKRDVSYVFFEEPKDQDKMDAEKLKKAQNDYGKLVNDFNEATLRPGAKLELIAAGMKMKTEATAPFTQDAAPEALKAEADLVSAIFAHDTANQPISDPIKGTKGYYIFSVLKTEEPKQQELKEVSDKIKEGLVLQKAQESMLKAANEAREALQAGLKEGKKIADLVKDKKLALVEVPEFSPSAPSPDTKVGREITDEAVKIPAGQLSTPVNTETGAALVFVNAKELRKREDSGTLRQSLQDSLVFREQFEVFKAWFERRREEAKLDVRFDAAA
jgi:hypothetical protein